MLKLARDTRALKVLILSSELRTGDGEKCPRERDNLRKIDKLPRDEIIDEPDCRTALHFTKLLITT